MPKYEHAVQVAEFSKDSLTQLKKTFAPTLESIFEARKKAGEAEGKGAKQIKESLGMFGLLGKALKIDMPQRNLYHYKILKIYLR